MVIGKLQAKCLSVAKMMPKGSGLGLVTDYRAMNELVELFEESEMLVEGEVAYCTLEVIERYW